MSRVSASRLEGGLRTHGISRTRTNPVVSVVTAVYNGAEHLSECIESVREQQQDYPSMEHVIIDGGSTDGTLQILQRYDKTLEYWVSEPDHGVYEAWNKGLAAARGEWIAFVGSDDVYRPGALKSYMRYIENSKEELDYVSSRVEVVGSRSGRVIGERWNWGASSEYMNVAHVGSLHHRKLFDQVGTFDPSYRITGDYELLLRARDGLRAGFVNEITATMRAGGISDSGDSIREAMRAKVASGGRNVYRARCEQCFALAKFRIRHLIFA